MAASDSLLTKDASSGNKFDTLIWASTFLVGTVLAEIANKQVAYNAAQYMLTLVLMMACLGIPVYFGLTAIVYKFELVKLEKTAICGSVSNWGLESADNAPAPAQFWCPPTLWWKPATIALLFVLHDMLLKVGGRGDSDGIIILVLLKLTIPFSMVFSILILHDKYTLWHCLALIPLFLGTGVCVVQTVIEEGGEIVTAHGALKAFFVALSAVPLAVSFVLVEKWLKREEKHVFPVAFWGWVCVAMFVIFFPLLPLGQLLMGRSVVTMFEDIGDGIQCLLGGSNPESAAEDVDCADGRMWVMLALLAIAISNVSMPLLTKSGSATLLWVVRALALPIGSMLFTQTWLMGSHAHKGSSLLVLGLLLTSGGVLLYNGAGSAQRT